MKEPRVTAGLDQVPADSQILSRWNDRKSAPTALQTATLALGELVRATRDRLTDDEYRAFASSALVFLARESDRLTLGDVLRALRCEAGS